MDETIDRLASMVLERFASIPPTERLLVAIAGVPGSGKSTLAYPLVDAINTKLEATKSKTNDGGLTTRTNTNTIDRATALLTTNSSNRNRDSAKDGKDSVPTATEDGSLLNEKIALAVGLDGWHYSRAQLDEFPDPIEALTRRGAAFTFDATSYLSFIQALREPIPLSPLPSPLTTPKIPYLTFSHSLKDPLPSPTPIKPTNRLIIIEGLYTLINEGIWARATGMMNFRIWLECDSKVVRDRLLKRCLREGIEDTVERAEKRVDGSDMLNGEWIKARLTTDADLIVIESKEDARLVASSGP
ncbi:BZ3500_MvSof-1268-A1-R1_Chr6-1g08375 [Microbotryum saponariae]|uniref:BZ3500_MvSof-1268-A1-R1_Chr6-1g08375 protein n=1 Tax=Microbotryum saponariae TaxID=289078 RepID=A0A2X0KKF9_9BASI|nr:BZ3500_MvSof-1268-A1-R1_Chr6-1g08375 [Microbotryum saponariae]SDA07659.1 BZ3501_MvSof-1269-A2-R1_Chr6-1g08096 [Microbotryum saponariae]